MIGNNDVVIAVDIGYSQTVSFKKRPFSVIQWLGAGDSKQYRPTAAMEIDFN